MVCSKFKPWGIIVMIIMVPMFLGILFMIYSLASVIFFGENIFKRGTISSTGAVFVILWLACMAFALFYAWLKFFFIIKINPSTKSILFKNIFTRKTFDYSCDDFDGYMDIYAQTKNGSYKVLYLIKNRRAIKIITGYYYSNMDEMQ